MTKVSEKNTLSTSSKVFLRSILLSVLFTSLAHNGFYLFMSIKRIEEVSNCGVLSLKFFYSDQRDT